MPEHPQIPVSGESHRGKVVMARELSDEEEWTLIVFAVIRALARWPLTWKQELETIAATELEAQRQCGGDYPSAPQERSL